MSIQCDITNIFSDNVVVGQRKHSSNWINSLGMSSIFYYLICWYEISESLIVYTVFSYTVGYLYSPLVFWPDSNPWAAWPCNPWNPRPLRSWWRWRYQKYQEPAWEIQPSSCMHHWKVKDNFLSHVTEWLSCMMIGAVGFQKCWLHLTHQASSMIAIRGFFSPWIWHVQGGHDKHDWGWLGSLVMANLRVFWLVLFVCLSLSHNCNCLVQEVSFSKCSKCWVSAECWIILFVLRPECALSTT